MSTPGAGKSRHGSARVVACDEALPAPGGALKIAARIGRSADVVIELLSVSNRVDPNTLLIRDRYSKHSHNACFHSSAFQGLGMTSNGPAGRRPMHEAAMLAATAFPLGIAAAWRTRPHRRPLSREPQKCVAARRAAANLAFRPETRNQKANAWAQSIARYFDKTPAISKNQKPETRTPGSPQGFLPPRTCCCLSTPVRPIRNPIS